MPHNPGDSRIDRSFVIYVTLFYKQDIGLHISREIIKKQQRMCHENDTFF